MFGALYPNWRSRSHCHMNVMVPQDHLIVGHLVHSTAAGGQPGALLREPNVCKGPLAEEARDGVSPPMARLRGAAAATNSEGLFLDGGAVCSGAVSASSCSGGPTGADTTVMAAPVVVWMIASSGICFATLRGFNLYSTRVFSHDHAWRAGAVSLIALLASWKRVYDAFSVSP